MVEKGHYTKSQEGLISAFGQIYVNQDDFDWKLPSILHMYNLYVKMQIMVLLMELLKELQNMDKT
ncbi:hypothetical protein [Methanobrevibacter sp.]|uniref:hypothetical protein n=1 Tax=Methanobrevibacter sp. TaxID=66852 RepID=UPI00388DF991